MNDRHHGRLLSRTNAFENVFNVLADGVLFLDESGKIVEANDAGLVCLRENDGLSLKNRRIACIVPNSDRKLEMLLAVMCGPDFAKDDPQAVVVPRPSGRPAYAIRLHRLPVKTGAFFNHAIVAAFIHDPCSKVPRDYRLFCDEFGMTPAEAGVAIALETGSTPTSFAAENGVSITTVRTQVQNAMRKAGVNRQVDLVRVLSSFWATVDGA